MLRSYARWLRRPMSGDNETLGPLFCCPHNGIWRRCRYDCRGTLSSIARETVAAIAFSFRLR